MNTDLFDTYKVSSHVYYLFLSSIFGVGNSATEMERGYGSDSGRINHEIGYGSELVGGTIGCYASGSGSGVVGRNDFQNWVLL